MHLACAQPRKSCASVTKLPQKRAQDGKAADWSRTLLVARKNSNADRINFTRIEKRGPRAAPRGGKGTEGPRVGLRAAPRGEGDRGSPSWPESRPPGGEGDRGSPSWPESRSLWGKGVKIRV
ncbi:unnamed protein product [Closterium sp. Yama58-4]|nr:unnamed protein product [Closterium sp. Yama58-4]